MCLMYGTAITLKHYCIIDYSPLIKLGKSTRLNLKSLSLVLTFVKESVVCRHQLVRTVAVPWWAQSKTMKPIGTCEP